MFRLGILSADRRRIGGIGSRFSKTEGYGMGRYFGTDGFRGKIGTVLRAEHAYEIGRFLGWYFGTRGAHRTRVVVGKDTRRSSYLLESALVAGLTASGADVYLLHVTTTPSVSYTVRSESFDFGVMISASHNPYYDNGIKLVNRKGEKMSGEAIDRLESHLDTVFDRADAVRQPLPHAIGEDLGRIIDDSAGRNRYIGSLISVAQHSFRPFRVGLDCANGSAWMIAKQVFDALGAATYPIHVTPDGVNINRECGSTDPRSLKEHVRNGRLDVGFAFDGDADRCIAVDENGNTVNGDQILYLLACKLAEDGELKQNTVAITVMSNLGLLHALQRRNIAYEVTDVGDRFLYERMLERDPSIGGEQSGHIILRKHAATGDGILTAIQVLERMAEQKLPLSCLVESVRMLPQITNSLPVTDRSAVLSDPEVLRKKQAMEEALGDTGRILLRAGGTEPVIRVMAEAETEETCRSVVDTLCEVIRARGYVSERSCEIAFP